MTNLRVFFSQSIPSILPPLRYNNVLQDSHHIFWSCAETVQCVQQQSAALGHFEETLDVSLHQTSTTRWSARVDCVRPLARHASDVLKAVTELSQLTNLTRECRADIDGIMSYFGTFESLLMSSIWVKFLTDIHDTNLMIQRKNTTLDVERINIERLVTSIKHMREMWPDILNEAYIVASNMELTTSFATKRGETQEEGRDRFKTDVFYVIVDSIIAGLTRRFTAVHDICNR